MFPYTAPATVVSWQAWGLRVRANDQVSNGTSYVFQSWSDGGAREHVITTPSAAATYTATFVPSGFTARVNFQPASAPVPAGYVADSGAVFGSRGNGFSYGWNAATNETRDRNSTLSEDQRFDTLNHMQIRAASMLVVSGTPTTTSRWVDATATVTVSDGRLTISNGTGAANNKICFVDLTRL